MINPVVIFGANALGKAAMSIFESNEVVIYGFLDDDQTLHNTTIGEVSVFGATDDDGYLKFIGNKCEAFVALDNNKERKTTVELLNKRHKTMPVNAIHKTAYIDNSSAVGHGNFINAGVNVGDNVSIGNHCIINTGAIIDYDASLGDFVQLGAGVVIGASAKIETEAFIGTGAAIIPGVAIGKGARIGAGSVVIENVPAGATVFGNPAKKV